VKSTAVVKGKRTEEIRYFLTSVTSNDDFACSVRVHWGIENQLHWHLDVTFDEDSSTVRNKNAAAVWNILRKLTLEYLKQVFGGLSLKILRKLFKWDSNFLERVVYYI
jgi:predicted transposase YbfD/YdcC